VCCPAYRRSRTFHHGWIVTFFVLLPPLRFAQLAKRFFYFFYCITNSKIWECGGKPRLQTENAAHISVRTGLETVPINCGGHRGYKALPHAGGNCAYKQMNLLLVALRNNLVNDAIFKCLFGCHVKIPVCIRSNLLNVLAGMFC